MTFASATKARSPLAMPRKCLVAVQAFWYVLEVRSEFQVVQQVAREDTSCCSVELNFDIAKLLSSCGF